MAQRVSSQVPQNFFVSALALLQLGRFFGKSGKVILVCFLSKGGRGGGLPTAPEMQLTKKVSGDKFLGCTQNQINMNPCKTLTNQPLLCCQTNSSNELKEVGG